MLAHLRLMHVRKNGELMFTRQGIHVELSKLPELLIAASLLAATGIKSSGGDASQELTAGAHPDTRPDTTSTGSVRLADLAEHA